MLIIRGYLKKTHIFSILAKCSFISDKDIKVKYKIMKNFEQYLGDKKSVILTATGHTNDAK